MRLPAAYMLHSGEVLANFIDSEWPASAFNELVDRFSLITSLFSLQIDGRSFVSILAVSYESLEFSSDLVTSFKTLYLKIFS